MRKDITIESHKKLLAYLLTWMRNDTLNHIARQNGLEEFHRALSYIMRQSGQDIAPQIENEMFKRELWHVLEKIVNTLPPQCSLVYKMVKFDGMDRSEVAEQLNITLSTVNNHMHKAHRLISERAKDY
jgi:RNA polymerase sigma-70 factor (ECF subfamily)